MPEARGTHAVDYESLAEFLAAIASPLRLELLDKLRVPRTLSEIRIAPRRIVEGENPERAVARQTVHAHLDKLVEAGLVHVESLEDKGRRGPVYATDPTRLYAVAEELRSLVVRYAGQGMGPDHTATASRQAGGRHVRGPRLVLVHGVYEGLAHPLSPQTSSPEGWTIGRARGLSVSLDYDPFVSHETARITRQGSGFAITDLGGKNGTWLNWGPLDAGETETLENGDIIGVGRSLLVFLSA